MGHLAMAKVVLASLLLFEAFLLRAMADKSESEVNPTQIKARSEGEPGWVVPREAAEPAASTPSQSTDEAREAEAPEIRRLGKHHSDKSVAGGGVIIGGLVTAIFAAVFAYIRVTRKRGGVY